MIRLKLPLLSNLASTLSQWAGEIRNYKFVTDKDLEIKTWEPSFRANGSLTLSSVEAEIAEYLEVGNLIWIWVVASFTTGGVASNTIYFTLPKKANLKGGTYRSPFSACITDSTDIAAQSRLNSQDEVEIKKYDNSNWGLGTGRKIFVSGCYQANNIVE